MTSAEWIPCRCGNARGDIDLGSGLCVECRRRHGEVTSAEIAAALERTDRTRGGHSLPVRWQTLLAPHWLWFSQPPAKDSPIRVLVLPIDERPA